MIVALMKIDAEIAELRGRPVSSSFKRVDPAEVFDDADTDLGFGD